MTPAAREGAGIWVYAALYFTCYIPYISATKLAGQGLWPAGAGPVPGPALLPVANVVSVVVMLLFIGATGWWRLAPRGSVAGHTLPYPGRIPALSGLCTALILSTTTMAYAIPGVSIVLMMLMMRGGVLVMAPVVDRLNHRRPRRAAWVALGLSLLALGVASRAPDGGLSGAALGVLAVYLGSYFLRLQLMSRLAKSPDPTANRRYFVEEQLVAAPVSVVLLGLLALVPWGGLAEQVRTGFTEVPGSPALLAAVCVGAASQGVGIFGTLVFLDPRENTYAVLVNRAASILAGVVATSLLAWSWGLPWPGVEELVGAGLVLLAMVVLALW